MQRPVVLFVCTSLSAIAGILTAYLMHSRETVVQEKDAITASALHSRPDPALDFLVKPESLAELESLVADISHWRQQPNRIYTIAASFRLIASQVGGQQAVLTGVELFENGRLPAVIIQAGIECVVISVLAAEKLERTELVNLLTK